MGQRTRPDSDLLFSRELHRFRPKGSVTRLIQGISPRNIHRVLSFLVLYLLLKSLSPAAECCSCCAPIHAPGEPYPNPGCLTRPDSGLPETLRDRRWICRETSCPSLHLRLWQSPPISIRMSATPIRMPSVRCSSPPSRFRHPVLGRSWIPGN